MLIGRVGGILKTITTDHLLIALQKYLNIKGKIIQGSYVPSFRAPKL